LDEDFLMNYRNAKYINDTGWIDCEIEHPKYGWIPYTVDPLDEDIRINNDDLLAGMAKAGNVAAYVRPTQAELDAALAAKLREARNNLLLDVDAVAGNTLRWNDLTTQEKATWATYRQSLLDVPQQGPFPNTVAWPNKPT
jgi:hypothetical protein